MKKNEINIVVNRRVSFKIVSRFYFYNTFTEEENSRQIVEKLLDTFTHTHKASAEPTRKSKTRRKKWKSKENYYFSPFIRTFASSGTPHMPLLSSNLVCLTSLINSILFGKNECLSGEWQKVQWVGRQIASEIAWWVTSSGKITKTTIKVSPSFCLPLVPHMCTYFSIFCKRQMVTISVIILHIARKFSTSN